MLALQDHVEDWFTFGLHLGVYVHVLNRLNRSYLTHVDYRNSTREMLTAWTDQFDREATWDKIVAALRKIGNNRLAQRVEKQYIMIQPTKQTAMYGQFGLILILCAFVTILFYGYCA